MNNSNAVLLTPPAVSNGVVAYGATGVPTGLALGNAGAQIRQPSLAS